jgi:hypothetical protein
MVAFQQMAERQRAQVRLLKRLAHFAYTNKSQGANTGTSQEEAATSENDNDTINAQNHISPNATLSKCPRDLWMLWDKYEHGLEGRKAAKDFNNTERGKVSSTYSKRNHVWQLIRRLVNQRGVHYSVAIDSIYEAYGDGISATNIIKAIQRDAKNDWHANLR